MINLSIKPSAVPSVWKIENIAPVFKSGDSTKPENHRPMSGLPIASKILEKTVHNNLITFLENKNRLTGCQTANTGSAANDQPSQQLHFSVTQCVKK